MHRSHSQIPILRTLYVKTYRLPTPLLTFQLGLIPGSLLTGLLLSPLLYLSRHLAQQPIHRLRLPAEKSVHRRFLALAFYAGSAIICLGLVGTWIRWCLGWRDPLIWLAYFLIEAGWRRPILIVYWALLAIISVGGWTRQLARARRQRRSMTASKDGSLDAQVSSPGIVTDNGKFGGVASQMMDAADQRLPILSVNARRKYFHALSVVMFVPGIALDVSRL